MLLVKYNNQSIFYPKIKPKRLQLTPQKKSPQVNKKLKHVWILDKNEKKNRLGHWGTKGSPRLCVLYIVCTPGKAKAMYRLAYKQQCSHYWAL